MTMASYLDEKSPKTEVSTACTTKDAKTRPLCTHKPLLFLLTLLFLAAACYCLTSNGSPFYQHRTPSTHVNPAIPSPDLPSPEYEPFEPLQRYSLKYGDVACWQDGGVWIKHLTPVEMLSLDIPRFEDTPRASSPADEEEFCTRLRGHGASFWALPPRWPENVVWCEDIQCIEPTKKVNFEVGFPSTGGMWVLDPPDVGREWTGKFQRRWGLGNALTMDERCEVIKDSGGRFCQDPKGCVNVSLLLGE